MKTISLLLVSALLAPLSLFAQQASSIRPLPTAEFQTPAHGEFVAAIDELNAIRAQLDLERLTVTDENRLQYLQAAMQLEQAARALDALVQAHPTEFDEARAAYVKAFGRLIHHLRIARQS